MREILSQLAIRIGFHEHRRYICIGMGVFGAFIAMIGIYTEHTVLAIVNVFIGGLLVGFSYNILRQFGW